MAIINNPELQILFQNLIDVAFNGAIAGQFFDLTVGTDVVELDAGTTAQNPGGVRALDSADFVTGSNSTDIINGNTGSDFLVGNDGNDYLRGGQDNDFISGITGRNIINGNRGNDSFLNGGVGEDLIRGGQDNDTLLGNEGNDYLIGDFGSDNLTGGFGADTFVLRVEASNGSDSALADAIFDFNLAEGDRIVIAGNIFAEDVSLSIEPVASLSTPEASVPGENVPIAGVLRQISTGVALGVIVGVTDVNQVLGGLELTGADDPILAIG
ncbi:Hemolysin-type calcium-binding region [Thalassoporum mexicanum PCC 7367]|uniref:calcium-binding protein n=1 Tax=Thalassoporum mexicanum TaxID=3457544 RepID=UPI00029FCC86|nr:calcium-binding protein [Pseudanabaena sp. PCC 7367]AFY69471.1 Hemolysin-type calcium-binding region [Pseudanabaena sp. PCC 7367]